MIWYWVSALAEHNQAFVGHQDGYLATLYHFRYAKGRKNVMSEDINRFDDCKLSNAKFFLNSECYPYDELNLDFDKNRYAILYDLYARFCKGYLLGS